MAERTARKMAERQSAAEKAHRNSRLVAARARPVLLAPTRHRTETSGVCIRTHALAVISFPVRSPFQVERRRLVAHRCREMAGGRLRPYRPAASDSAWFSGYYGDGHPPARLGVMDDPERAFSPPTTQLDLKVRVECRCPLDFLASLCRSFAVPVLIVPSFKTRRYICISAFREASPALRPAARTFPSRRIVNLWQADAA
jgi:hypothetical protein